MSTPLQVLLIQTQKTSAESILGQLHQAGFIPDCTRVETEADYLAHFHPDFDLILIDDTTPYLEIPRVMRHLQQHNLTMPVIVITSDSHQETTLRYLEHGEVDYVLDQPIVCLREPISQAAQPRPLRCENQQIYEALQKQTAAHLRESEEKFKAIFDNSLDLIMVIDSQNGQILKVNRAVRSILGYAEGTLTGQHFSILFPSAAEDVEDKTTEMFLSSQSDLTPQAFLRVDGAIRWMDLTVTMISWGVNRAILATFRDVTVRKQAEEALARERNLLRTLIDNIPDYIYVKDAAGRFIIANRAVAQVMGVRSPNELIDKTDFDFYPQALAAQYFADEQQVIRSGEPVINREEPLIHPNGDKGWILTTQLCLRDNQNEVTGLIGIGRDITKRKQHKRKLEAIATVTAALRTVVVRADILPIILDQLLELLLIKAAALEICQDGTGETVIELARGTWLKASGTLVSPRETDLESFFHNANSYVISQMQNDVSLIPSQLLSSVQTVACVPLVVQSRFMGVLWMGHNEEITPDDVYLLTAIGDITASALYRARLYEELHLSNAALTKERALLARRVAERTAELSAANAQLARAARLKDEFLANMSHELRTPLNVILGMGEILQGKVYGVLNQDQASAVRYIEESSRHLLALINDILDISKFEAGKLELDIRPVSVIDVCEGSLRFVRQMAQKKDIDVLFTFETKNQIMMADERRLKQILVNLLTNAVKFTPEGGQVGLDIVCENSKDILNFVIWDTGIGISEDNIKHLFKPFVQLDSSLSRHYEGAGLGLSLAYRLTEMHGGSITVKSNPKQGSQFTVSLPGYLADQTLQASKQEQLKTFPSKQEIIDNQRSELILLVEDNKMNLNLFLDFLEANDYLVIVARNGVEAIERTKEEKPDLIVMDIQLPVLDGLEAIQRIKADVKLAEIPIIALTALAMPGDQDRCLAAGAAEYLSKPVRLSYLAQAIQRQLQPFRQS